MVPNHVPPPDTGPGAAAEPDLVQPVCPMCHTRQAPAKEAVEEGGSWLCTRCGQQWDAARLAAVAGYQAWVSGRLARTS